MIALANLDLDLACRGRCGRIFSMFGEEERYLAGLRLNADLTECSAGQQVLLGVRSLISQFYWSVQLRAWRYAGLPAGHDRLWDR